MDVKQEYMAIKTVKFHLTRIFKKIDFETEIHNQKRIYIVMSVLYDTIFDFFLKEKDEKIEIEKLPL